MKIAYFAAWDFSNQSGVQQKILDQVQTWNQLGVQTELFVITPQPATTSSEVESKAKIHIITSNLTSAIQGSQRTYLNKVLCVSAARTKLTSFSPDLIFYRMGIWHPGLTSILKLAPTVLEVNSREVKELENTNLFKRMIYPWGRRQILSAVAAICPVSHEIMSDLNIYQKPTFVCGNGANFEIGGAVPRKIISSRPQALFVGSEGQRWHGTDLILRLAQKLPEIDFHFVGAFEKVNAQNIVFHGMLFGKDLDCLASKMDIGIGTLALFRNGMSEASPLKTRQYGKWGLPYVYAFDDTDLPSTFQFALKLPNDEAQILKSDRTLLDFANRHLHQSHNADLFRPYFDRFEKEKKRIVFFEKLLEGKVK